MNHKEAIKKSVVSNIVLLVNKPMLAADIRSKQHQTPECGSSMVRQLNDIQKKLVAFCAFCCCSSSLLHGYNLRCE